MSSNSGLERNPTVDIFYAPKSEPGEEEIAARRAHTQGCSGFKPSPIIIAEEHYEKDEKREVRDSEVVVLPYSEDSDIHLYASHTSLERLVNGDVVIAIGSECVIFARIPTITCYFCLEKSTHAPDIFTLYRRHRLHTFVLQASTKDGDKDRPIYLGDNIDIKHHLRTVRKAFDNGRWLTQHHPYYPGFLVRPAENAPPDGLELPAIIEVGHWNKNSKRPAIRLNDRYQHGVILENKATKTVRFATPVPIDD